MKLIIEPEDGVGPVLSALKKAKKSIDVAIFRLDRKDVEDALKAAAERGVQVTALIAFANRGGAKSLRRLELRFLEAGIIVARTADDLVRYHGKYILIDRRVLYVLSFNFTRIDIDRSRGFGLVTKQPLYLQEAARLFKADCMRTRYLPKVDTFVVSPANSRQTLATFLGRAKKQLLIYDPKISDKEMQKILADRTKAGVDVRVIGQVSGASAFPVQKLAGMRIHTRTIIRDRHQAFIGSQSLRAAELDSRREVGLIVKDPATVKKLIAVFESDWAGTAGKDASAGAKKNAPDGGEGAGASRRQVSKVMKVLAKELQPLATGVKKAVRQAVVKAGEEVLDDHDVKDSMKKVVKHTVKDAVKDALQDVQNATPAAKD